MVPSALYESLVCQYRQSPVPFALADEQLRLIWYNQAAKEHCPSLIIGKGLESVKLTVGTEKLFQTLCSGQVFHTPCLQEPLFRYAVTIVPLLEEEQLAGAMVTASLPLTGSEPANGISSSEHLSAVFSQQLREPLFSIFSSLQLLSSALEHGTAGANLKQTVYGGLQQINRQCYHLLRFALNFTELIRLENGVSSQHSCRIELCGLLERLCSALYLTARDQETAFSFQLPPKPLYLSCDADRLIYSILLLMANAFRFAPKGNVSLKVSVQGNTIHTIVSDDGCGIPAENLPRIYDACYSFDPVSNCPAGSGLGLTVLRQLVLSCGGTLMITSQGFGKGTTAAFDLPYEKDTGIPLLHMDPIQDHFNDRFSLYHILMSAVAEPPEV